MSKKKIKQMQKEYSKPQLSRWQKQRKIQRYIFFGGIGLIIAVLLFVGVGWYFTQYIPLNASILKVNSSDIKMIDYVRLLRYTLNTTSSSNTDISQVANDVLDYLAQGEVVRQGAAEVGITVSNSEIKEVLKAYNQNWDYAAFVRLQLLQSKLYEYHIKPQLPEYSNQRELQAMFLESEEQANEIRNQILALPESEQKSTFNELASELSLNKYTKENNGDLGMHVQEVFDLIIGSSIPGEYAFASEKGAFSQPWPDDQHNKQVGYWLIQVLEQGIEDNEGKIHVQAMLLGSLEEAGIILTRLEDGDDFNNIAKELSQYIGAQDDGGDLGFIAKGKMGDIFDDVAFNQEIGIISEPIKDTSVITTGGYWLIRVLDAVVNEDLSQEDIDYLSYQKYNQWYTDKHNSATFTDSITSEQFYWAIQKASR